MKNYRIIIVGAGPAGIFAALTLKSLGLQSILLLEQGEDIEKRERKPGKSMVCGWGGAGAFSDGKLTLSTQVGGFLEEFVPREEFRNLLVEADQIYVHYGAPEKTYGTSSDQGESFAHLAKQAGMEYIPMRIRHIGTENWTKILGQN